MNASSHPAAKSTAVLSVIVPAYNEEKTLAELLETVLAQDIVGEVIAVNDCSTDKTREILQQFADKDKRLRFVEHEQNQGKGAALRTGIAQASLPFVIIQDADLEYDPSEYPSVLAPLIDDQCEVCYGSRYLKRTPHRVKRYWHTMGNRFLTWMSNMMTDLYLTDMETCYKAFRREVIQNIKIEENRFGFEPEITAKIARQDLRIIEVPVTYKPRSFDDGKHIGWKDGVRAIYCILKYGLFQRG